MQRRRITLLRVAPQFHCHLQSLRHVYCECNRVPPLKPRALRLNQKPTANCVELSNQEVKDAHGHNLNPVDHDHVHGLHSRLEVYAAHLGQLYPGKEPKQGLADPVGLVEGGIWIYLKHATGSSGLDA